MKYFALFAAAVVVCVDASGHGSSAVTRHDDGHGNYAFAYDENHASGGSFRKEKGGHGGVVGSYGLTDHDGRKRIVNYVADAHGFRADIKTNEPGVDPKEDPAAVSINGGHKALIAPIGYAEPSVVGWGGPKLVAGPALGYASAEGLGYGGLGGYGGPLGGISGSYSAHINHVSAPVYVKAAPLGYGSYGKW